MRTHTTRTSWRCNRKNYMKIFSVCILLWREVAKSLKSRSIDS
ncbi:hypothetical protein CIPAW_05G110900 [Carya illinoinensis]|uniref:Uncharacterized protein n=1 Tax=Carya illinoinensis TaxID=32201 RepID=A0A8T1QIA2_CARIL|nr:hypothetical protein CIPAW_05G110900 [Carya illinoinensis]